MPNPKAAIEALGVVAAKGASEVAERLLADTANRPVVRFSKGFVDNFADPVPRSVKISDLKSPLTAFLGPDGYYGAEAVKHTKRPILSLTGNNAAAAERQIQSHLSGGGTDRQLRTLADKTSKPGFRYVGDEMVLVGSSNMSKSRAKVIEEKLNAEGVEVDAVHAARKFMVAWKPAEKGAAGKGAELLAGKTTANAAEKGEAAAAEKVSKPVVHSRPSEPVMPTRAFETAGDRKIVSKLADGSILTDYQIAPLPFRFTDPNRASRSLSYGESAYTVKQVPDGSVTIGNPEGINKIGQAWESAHNTLGLQPSKLDLNFMPKWFQARHEHLAETGVPAWFKGDQSWLYGQVNGARGIRPVEANFTGSRLNQIKYDSPVRVGIGPFEGLTGDAMGFAKNGDAVLVNTRKLVGDKPETFVYRKGGTNIETWRLIPQASGENEIKRVLLTPRSLLNLVER